MDSPAALLPLCLLGVAAGLFLLWRGMSGYRTALTVGDTSTSAIDSLAAGEVRISGEIEAAEVTGTQCNLYAFGPFEQFAVSLRVSFIAGVIASSPIWLYQLGAFITPGLHRKEKKYAAALVASFGEPGPTLFVGRTITTDPLKPGMPPRTSNRLFSVSTFTTVRLRMVIRSLPY